MKRLTYVVLIVALSIPASEVYGFIQSAAPGTGTTLKWFVLPIQYRINSKGTPDVPGTAELPAIDAAFATWDAIANSDLAFVNGGMTTLGLDPMDNTNTILWLDDASDDPRVVARPDALALTDVRFDPSTGEILESDIALNGVAYSWAVSGNDNFSSLRGPADIQAVVTHEIGHFIGLDHVTSSTSVMFVSKSMGSTASGRTTTTTGTQTSIW